MYQSIRELSFGKAAPLKLLKIEQKGTGDQPGVASPSHEEGQARGHFSVLARRVLIMQRKPKVYADGIFPFGFLEIFRGEGNLGDSDPTVEEEGERVQLPREYIMHFHPLSPLSAHLALAKTKVFTGLSFVCEYVIPSVPPSLCPWQ